MAALTDREVITVRLDYEPKGKQPAMTAGEADAGRRHQLDGRELLSQAMSGVPAVPWHRPMSGRDPEESHRASTPLELFFDLCFVVAVAAAAATLHHDLALDHLDGLVGYAMVFFAIWWAWVNYSWFASAYDTGDIIFRLLTFVVMTGVLVRRGRHPARRARTRTSGCSSSAT